jgi:SAM-dependent methyltransferase
MLENPSCEVCGRRDWRTLGERVYLASAIATSDPYVRKRLRTLFDVWARGRTDFRITSVVCRNCGFLIYLPRPNADDLEAKYRYLASTGPADARNPEDHPIELSRAEQLWRYITGFLDLSKVARVLDYGGMDGRLMSAFRKRGRDCYLVDYSNEVASGITKLGDRIHDVDEDERFDLIVCSHVLEHVAQPRQVLERLRRHLSDSGYIFVEVPMEVWRRAPLPEEPVTHINFFTPNSLRNLLTSSGLDVVIAEMVASPHPSGRRKHAIRAVAAAPQSGGADVGEPRCLPPDAEGFIDPSLGTMLAHYTLIPEDIPRLAAREAVRFVRRSLSGSGARARDRSGR